jgi:hypothetical protein
MVGAEPPLTVDADLRPVVTITGLADSTHLSFQGKGGVSLIMRGLCWLNKNKQ